MADSIVLTYDVVANDYIAASQNVAANQPFILKGSTPYVPITSGPVWLEGQQRPVSITSTDDMSGVLFQVTGYQLGVQSPDTIVTSQFPGPTAGATVQSALQFQTILSVVPQGNATNCSVGLGNGATFEWKRMDTFRPYAQYSYQGVVGGTISYSVLQTLEKIQNPPDPFYVITGFQNNDSVTIPYTANVFYSFSYPVTGLQLIVNATGTNGSGSLELTILQQGIR